MNDTAVSPGALRAAARALILDGDLSGSSVMSVRDNERWATRLTEAFSAHYDALMQLVGSCYPPTPEAEVMLLAYCFGGADEEEMLLIGEAIALDPQISMSTEAERPGTANQPVGKEPNAAIGFDQRSIVAACVRRTVGVNGSDKVPDESDSCALLELAARLDRPGPPLVSASDVDEVLDLVAKLSRMRPGEELDHHWGYVRRISEGFMVAGPGQYTAEGNWRSDNVVARAQEMYEDHLRGRGLVPSD